MRAEPHTGEQRFIKPILAKLAVQLVPERHAVFPNLAANQIHTELPFFLNEIHSDLRRVRHDAQVFILRYDLGEQQTGRIPVNKDTVAFLQQ